MMMFSQKNKTNCQSAKFTHRRERACSVELWSISRFMFSTLSS
jgi:hypothetical protein